MKNFAILCLLLGFTSVAQAKTTFNGHDFTGVYACAGEDAQEGSYSVTLTFKLNRAQSVGQFGAYDYALETENSDKYRGQAVAQGYVMAMGLAFNADNKKDHGSAIATIKKNKFGRWSFRKFDYEPEYKGGNHSIESCDMKPPVKLTKR